MTAPHAWSRRRHRPAHAARLGAALAGSLTAAPALAADPADLLPRPEERAEVCAFIADTPFRGRMDYVLHLGVFDVNNDGTPERVERPLSRRSIGGDEYAVSDLAGRPLSWDPVGFDWLDDQALGEAWLPFKGRVYSVHFADPGGRFLSYVSYITPENREVLLCDFDNAVAETIRPVHPYGEQHAAICRQLDEGPPPVAVEISPVDPSAGGPGSDAAGRPETILAGTVAVDFDNDGKTEELALLRYASEGGRRCDLDYYDLLEAPGRVARTGAAHDRLMALQGIADPQQPRLGGPTCAGNRARWLVLDGTTYLETGYPGEAPTSEAQLFHEVHVLEDGTAHRVCAADFEITARIRTLPDLP